VRFSMVTFPSNHQRYCCSIESVVNSAVGLALRGIHAEVFEAAVRLFFHPPDLVSTNPEIKKPEFAHTGAVGESITTNYIATCTQPSKQG
jgi:hypothetical protein